MNIYDEVFSFKNLYNAHIKARRSKRHKKDVILFEVDLGNNLWKLKKQLDSRKYVVKGYNHFMIMNLKYGKLKHYHIVIGWFNIV